MENKEAIKEIKDCAICQTNKYAQPLLQVFDNRTQQFETILFCSKCNLNYVNEPERKNYSFKIENLDSSRDISEVWSEQSAWHN